MQLTTAAAAQVTDARREHGLPETFGLRVFGEPQPGGGTALALAFAEGPGVDDEVKEQQGVLLFLAPEVVEPLASAALDVEETPEGPQLILKTQESGED